MKVDVREMKITIPLVSGLPPMFENLIVDLHELGSRDRLFTRFLREELATLRNWRGRKCKMMSLVNLATSLPFSVMVKSLVLV